MNHAFNPVINYDFSNSSAWVFSGGSYTTLANNKVLQITGSSNNYRFAYQEIYATALNEKQISNGKYFMLSGWVISPNSTSNIDTEMYENIGGSTFGLSCIVRYEDGTTKDVRVNANPLITDWQYISLMYYIDKPISRITMFCSFDMNSGYAYFDNISLRAVSGSRYEYNSDNYLTKVYGDNGVITNTYDNSKLISQTTPAGTINNIYTNNLITETLTDSINGTRITNDYTYENGNLISQQVGSNAGPKKITTSSQYSSNGLLLEATWNADGKVTNYYYDNQQRLSQIENHNLVTTNYTYNTKGQISKIAVDIDKNQLINTDDPFIEYSYNNANQVTSIKKNNSTYNFAYNNNADLLSVSIVGITEKLVEYEYNNKYQPTKIKYGNGDEKNYLYNSSDGKVSSSGYNGLYPFTYSYNSEGDISQYNDTINNTTTLYYYDVYSRLYLTELRDINTLALLLKVEYIYDSLNRLSYIKETDQARTNTYNYVYHGNTAIVKYVYCSGIYIHYEYDYLERITSKKVTSNSLGTGTIYSSETYTYKDNSGDNTTPYIRTVTLKSGATFRYVYNDLGNIISIFENEVKKLGYSYDNVGQLIREDNAYFNKSYVFTYDLSGNTTSRKEYAFTFYALGPVISTNNYTYDKDRLISSKSNTITYDGAGNPEKWRNTSSMSWDGKNFTGMNVGPFSGIAIKYNSAGLRTEKLYGPTGITTKYIRDVEGNLIYETRSSGYSTQKIEYIYDGAGSITGMWYTDTSGLRQRYMYGKNAQGDVVEIYNYSGTLVVRYNYTAWGEVVITSDTSGVNIGTINPIRYRSYYYDTDLSFYYLNTRYYDPVVGRFLNADSTLGANGNILSYNLYAYCSNNPVRYIDPNGDIPVALIIVGILVSGLVVQTASSILLYGGYAISSLWDADVRNDMKSIKWNPFNSDEAKVLRSKKVSFYKGIPVFRTNLKRSGSFLAIWLNQNSSVNADTVRHEFGHSIQQLIMNPVFYGISIAIPSYFAWGPWSYYNKPWEVTADILGGVKSRSPNKKDVDRGWWYLAVATLTGPFSYLFLLEP
ncbi:MAG: RHS repeat-associated core domain-containing protein [Eubacteriales bacterium]|nr:RHS repeat-associated core domain-containing protein [Eubacteriales bacterium]MDD4475558.1 RHS repeat-associated core domain-containing protein [Eubacteriales bacterium]